MFCFVFVSTGVVVLPILHVFCVDSRLYFRVPRPAICTGDVGGGCVLFFRFFVFFCFSRVLFVFRFVRSVFVVVFVYVLPGVYVFSFLF